MVALVVRHIALLVESTIAVVTTIQGGPKLEVRGYCQPIATNNGEQGQTSRHGSKRESPAMTVVGKPWHGRGQGFESPKLHPRD